MNWQNEDEHQFAEAAFKSMAAAADPILARRLGEIGQPMESLSRAQRFELLKASMIEAAASQNPHADFDQMRRVFDLMADSRFTDALGRLRKVPYGGAFHPAYGVDAALVLAGAGLPVLPLDRKTGRPIGPIADGLDDAERIFAKAKTAMVGYASAKAPFYLLATDCVIDAHARVTQDPAFSALKAKLDGPAAPPDTPRFRHGLMLFARDEADRIKTRVMEDADPNRGSVMLLAGWMEDTEPQGVSNDGFVPVPEQLVHKLISDPAVLQWLTRPMGGLVAKMH